jgi:hypothetical protein
LKTTRQKILTVTVCVEEGVDLRSEKAAKDERLLVEAGPAVQRPHSNPREVRSMRVSGLEVKMGEQVLQFV